MPDKIIPGIYRHYKGDLYRIIGTGIHTETNEEFVFYFDNKMKFFVRPAAMFLEEVNPETGGPVSLGDENNTTRFTLVHIVNNGWMPIADIMRANEGK